MFEDIRLFLYFFFTFISIGFSLVALVLFFCSDSSQEIRSSIVRLQLDYLNQYDIKEKAKICEPSPHMPWYSIPTHKSLTYFERYKYVVDFFSQLLEIPQRSRFFCDHAWPLPRILKNQLINAHHPRNILSEALFGNAIDQFVSEVEVDAW